jgi:hypothetical protein
MNNYAYQIHGALENAQGHFKGLRVLVCDLYNFELVDVPVEVLDHETAKFIQFRLQLSTQPLDIQRLPVSVQNRIRAPLGPWLDYWVGKNFYGSAGESKNINT